MSDAAEREELLTSDALCAGTRADVFISDALGITRSAAQKLLDDGKVLSDGKAVAKNYKIRANDTFTVSIPEPKELDVAPENIPLDVVYEDGDIIVINKPAGMVVHPAPGHETGTLVSALLYHCGDTLSSINGVTRPGIVHRIDRDTTGLIAVAKNDAAHLSLSEQLKDHTMRREYEAIVVGKLPEERGTVDRPIARHPTDRKKMATARTGDSSAREAVTHYEALSFANGFTLARMKLETGRTHQIRVHMASIGHPVLGDPVYGGDGTLFEKHHPSLFTGQMLHARRLTLIHPSTKVEMTFEAPLPENFTKCARLLELLPDGD
ncbi:MAG: RluA family pseudouridine synthase [Clostridia bacterium]|nr:RluA family pseudouridine synthase [Clostridia bacterium]